MEKEHVIFNGGHLSCWQAFYNYYIKDVAVLRSHSLTIRVAVLLCCDRPTSHALA